MKLNELKTVEDILTHDPLNLLECAFEMSPKRVGMAEIRINVSRGGMPFGMIWTWPNTATEKHPWHAQPLNGDHATFSSRSAAERHMRSL